MTHQKRWISVVLLGVIAFALGYERDALGRTWQSVIGGAGEELSADEGSVTISTAVVQPENPTEATSPPSGANPPGVPGIPAAGAGGNVAPGVGAASYGPPGAPGFGGMPAPARLNPPTGQTDSLSRTLEAITPPPSPPGQGHSYFDKLNEQLRQSQGQPGAENPIAGATPSYTGSEIEEEVSEMEEEEEEFDDDEIEVIDEEEELSEDEYLEDDDEEEYEDLEEEEDVEEDPAAIAP